MLKKYGRELALLSLLIVLSVLGASYNPNFFGVANLLNLSRQIGLYGIFSLGVGLVIITSGIDLSIGSVFALLGVILSILLVEKHVPIPLAVTAVLIVASLIGCIHSLLINRLKLQPFIVTLCGLLIYRGIAQYISHDETKGFGDSKGFEGLKEFANGQLFGVPTPFFLMLMIAGILWVVLHRSVYGRHLFAVGRNEEAARFSGIQTKRVIGIAYIACALLAGVTSVLLAFYTNSVSPSTHGQTYELYGIAAAVLGGCSLRGGEGSVVGILLGTVLLQVLQNLVNLLGIPSSLNFAVVGAVILIGVVVDLLFAGGLRKA